MKSWTAKIVVMRQPAKEKKENENTDQFALT